MPVKKHVMTQGRVVKPKVKKDKKDKKKAKKGGASKSSSSTSVTQKLNVTVNLPEAKRRQNQAIKKAVTRPNNNPMAMLLPFQTALTAQINRINEDRDRIRQQGDTNDILVQLQLQQLNRRQNQILDRLNDEGVEVSQLLPRAPVAQPVEAPPIGLPVPREEQLSSFGRDPTFYETPSSGVRSIFDPYSGEDVPYIPREEIQVGSIPLVSGVTPPPVSQYQGGFPGALETYAPLASSYEPVQGQPIVEQPRQMSIIVEERGSQPFTGSVTSQEPSVEEPTSTESLISQRIEQRKQTLPPEFRAPIVEATPYGLQVEEIEIGEPEEEEQIFKVPQPLLLGPQQPLLLGYEGGAPARGAPGGGAPGGGAPAKDLDVKGIRRRFNGEIERAIEEGAITRNEASDMKRELKERLIKKATDPKDKTKKWEIASDILKRNLGVELDRKEFTELPELKSGDIIKDVMLEREFEKGLKEVKETKKKGSEAEKEKRKSHEEDIKKSRDEIVKLNQDLKKPGLSKDEIKAIGEQIKGQKKLIKTYEKSMVTKVKQEKERFEQEIIRIRNKLEKISKK